jgi:nucleoredoxin
MAALFAGKTLIRKNGDKVSGDTLGDKKIIVIYFSAHWCPPCRMFTPILAEFYDDATDDKLPLEIVFVSSDKNEEEMLEYMNESHGDWLGVKYGDALANDLKAKFGISGIPAVVVLAKDGSIITKDGKTAIQNKGLEAAKEWIK